jgi:uncharacterized protein DUF2442
MKRQQQFQITGLQVMQPYGLRLTFGDGEVLTVDLEAIIERIPPLAPLKEPKLFAQARLGEWGSTVEWASGELDLAGDNLRAEAVEQSGRISHERIWEWMYRNNLTLDTASQALGISRRMLAYYRSGQKPVPRYIWLACVGWEAERTKAA